MSKQQRDLRRLLFAVDAVVNLVLGLVMSFVPGPAAKLLGAPDPGSGFYVRVLGAVLIGIGLALLLELGRERSGGRTLETRGLGLEGAVAINLCGAAAVAVWLVVSGGLLPVRGRILLWGVVGVLVVLSLLELRRSRQLRR